MAAKPGKFQKIALALALAGLVAAVSYNRLYTGGGEEAVFKDSGVKLGHLPPAKMPVVDLSLLESLNVPVDVSRNIFDPVYRPPVVKPKPVIPPPAVDKRGGVPTGNISKPPAPPPRSREEIEADKARAEISKFRFIGFVSRKDTLDIFLALGDEYATARPGGDIDAGEVGKYYIKTVKPDAIVIADKAHKVNGKEVETSIKADFEGKDIDIITNASAPYVGAGASGGSLPGVSTGGQPAPPPGSNPRQNSPSGRRRGPAAPPRGVTSVQTTTGGAAAAPVNEEETPAEETGEEAEQPAPLNGNSL